MHTMVVRMSVDPARNKEVREHITEEVVHWARRQPGFVSGQWLCVPGDNLAMGVVVFDSAQAANTAANDPREYAKTHRDEGRPGTSKT